VVVEMVELVVLPLELQIQVAVVVEVLLQQQVAQAVQAS
jgi:hypothetical protein